MGKPDEASKVVDYLKTKAAGVSLKEAKATIGETYFDSRKISAYTFWGLISYENEKINLTDFGRRFAREQKDNRNAIFSQILFRIHVYKVSIEWIFHQGMSSVTVVDLAAHLHDHFLSDLGTTSVDNIRRQVTTFFLLAQECGFGNFIIGRKKQPSRFEVNRDVIGQSIGEQNLSSRKTEIKTQGNNDNNDEENIVEENLTNKNNGKSDNDELRVFVSHSKNKNILDQVKTMLNFTNMYFEVAEEDETTAIPVSEKVLSAMRRCNSAVICVTADDEKKSEDGHYKINENVLIEIGAAFVLYDKKVVLVWDKRLSIPSNLQGLYRCEFEGEELSWDVGMKLMKGVNNFKK